MKRLSDKKLRIILHGLVWLALIILPAYLFNGHSPRDKAFLAEVWLQVAFFAILFYVSYLWLVPHFFFGGRKGRFYLWTTVMIVTATLLFGMVIKLFEPDFRRQERMIPPKEMRVGDAGLMDKNIPRRKPPPIRWWPVFNFMITASLLSALSVGLRYSDQLALNEKLRKEAEKAKSDAELSLLKHQINPHFLFNTLNSIYGLALTQSEKTAEAVMKLSDMMRYVLQEVSMEKVPLEMELEYLHHYVELEKLRLTGNVTVEFRVEGNPAGMMIPPVILVPFVENAFKFGASAHEPAAIQIFAKAEHGQLAFHVSNPVFPHRKTPETFGIGIQNTRKRLEMIYPQQHRLELIQTDTRFIVELNIQTL